MSDTVRRVPRRLVGEWAAAVVLWVGVLVLSLLLAVPAATPAAGAAGPCGGGDPSPRRGVWYAIGDTPTVQEVDAAAARYGVVVLNPWETWALQRIERADPSVVVLAYKDLSSTRSYHAGSLPPAGVSTAEAEAQPEWFAVDTAGARIEWDPYPGHWQMAVWDTGYQQRWVDNVVAETTTAGWDGVLADNDMTTLRHYDSAVLAGTSSQDETDARLRGGLDALVDRAGRALQAAGKLFVPNASDTRLYPGRWTAHAAFGGAMDEQFAHWGTATDSGHLWDWGLTGWVTQTDQLAAPGLAVTVTRAAPGDTRTLLYGYASVLVRGDARDYWTPSTAAAGDYTRPEYLDEMSIRVGTPTGAAVRAASGVWTRTFGTGWAAVNPTLATVTVTAPPGTVDAQGKRVLTVSLRPTSGAVFRTEPRGC